MLTAILVDDMSNALELLRNDVAKLHPEIEIIALAKSVVEAAKVIRKHEPDILFLDIMLGDGTGFDVLEIFPNLKSKIIFVTASDEHAIRAFKFAAIDYVLKPYDDVELSKAIEKAKIQIQTNPESLSLLKESISEPDKTPQKISLHSLDKIEVVSLDNIVHCRSDNNNTIFYLNDQRKIFVTRTLKYFADMLKPSNFIRVHRSHLVNAQYIKAFIKTDGGYILLKNKTTVPVSARKKTEVIEFLRDTF
jgi:two-component system LytT family response regulator